MRKSVPESIQARVLSECTRRCCICYWLQQIDRVRKGQIVHLNGNASDSSYENLAFLCLEHHDEFDSRTSQSKGYTTAEVKKYRNLMLAKLRNKSTPIRNTPADQDPPIEVFWKGHPLEGRTEVILDLRDMRSTERPSIELDFHRQHGSPEGRATFSFGFIMDPFITEMPDWGSEYPSRTILPDGRHFFRSKMMAISLVAGDWAKYKFTLYFENHAVDELIDANIRIFSGSKAMDYPFRIRILGSPPAHYSYPLFR